MIHTETGMLGEVRRFYVFSSALAARQALGAYKVSISEVWHVSCCEYRVYL